MQGGQTRRRVNSALLPSLILPLRRGVRLISPIVSPAVLQRSKEVMRSADVNRPIPGKVI